MNRLLVLLFAVLAGALPARAKLSLADLATVGVSVPDGAALPLDLVVTTGALQQSTLGNMIAGKPTLLLPVDPRCRVVCGPALSILGGALAATGLRAGRDFRLVLLTIGRSDEGAARAFAEAQLGDNLREATTLVTGPPDSVRRITDTLGSRFAEDADNEAVAHPSAFFALTGQGRVARVLSSLALNPDDLRLALVEAGRGQVGNLGDQLRLLCYGFDAAHGVYTSRIRLALQIGAVGIMGAIGAGLWWLGRRRRDLSAAFRTGEAR